MSLVRQVQDMDSMNLVENQPENEKISCRTSGSQEQNGQLNLVFSIDQQAILTMFEEIVERMEFNLIQRQQNIATAIKKKKTSVFNITNCFKCLNTGNYTCLKIQICKTKRDNKQICRLYGLTGERHLINTFCLQFATYTQAYQIKQNFIYQTEQIQKHIQISNPYLDQNSYIFLTHRILSNQALNVAQIVRNYINKINSDISCINQQYQNLPKIMNNVIKIIQKITISVIKQINDNSSQSTFNEKYIPLAVERYIFQKISNQLFLAYQQKDKIIQQRFQMKKKLIFKELTIQQIFNQICLDSRIRFMSPEQMKNKTSIKGLRDRMQLQNVCKQIQKITLFSNPRQKAKYCESMFAGLKSYVDKKSKAKIELKNMEDIIPFTILILLLSETINIRAQINIIKDFLKEDDNDQLERYLINLSESFNFIEAHLEI